jgi:hypothetical protein
MTEQIVDLEGLSPEQIADATTAGRLDVLLGGDPIAIAIAKGDARAAAQEAEAQAAAVKVDQGARGTAHTRYDESWLATATPEEIARATAEGKLDKLL